MFFLKNKIEKISLEETLSVLKKQEAVLVRKEEICDLFLEGEYNLQRETMPLLKAAIDLKNDNEDDSCDIYYINKGYVASILWGTGEPVIWKGDSVESEWILRLNGECNLRVSDTRTFIKLILEQEKELNQIEWNLYFRKLLLNVLRENIDLITKEWKTEGEEIKIEINKSSLVLGELYEKAIAQTGLELIGFCINEVHFKIGDEKIKKCPKCERTYTMDDYFCVECGTKLEVV